MTDDRTRVHALLSGRVQGVSFRAATQAEARRNGVSGWVRNTSDGRVEAVFEGRGPDVDRMIEWCRDGPPAARVEDIQVNEQGFAGDFDTFSIRR